MIGLTNCALPSPRPISTPIPTPSGSHQVTFSDLGLTEIWRHRAGIAEAYDLQLNPPPLIIAHDKVIISSYVDLHERNDQDSFLTARALDSGKIIWQTRYSGVGFGTRVNSSYFDSTLNRIYLQYSSSIGAFDAETGKQLWVTPNLGDHITYIFAHEQQDGVLTVTSNNHELLTFDPNDGRLLSRQKVAHFLTITHAGTEIAIPQESDSKWAFDCHRPVVWPTFVGDEDVLLECPWPYMLYRANTKTGKTVWRSPPSFVSNYAIRNNTLYIMDRATGLDSINIETGKYSGRMSFDGKFPTDGVARFWVAIQDSYLIIYLGDTQELVAFSFNEK
jgi:outer membrane protein assembly factor BamB